jgi:hypothetical protein
MANGDTKDLRERAEQAPASSMARRPNLLVLAIDGVGRELLYGMLERGELPELAKLLAYQGAVAYVYIADRSTCERKGQRCDWKRPPRFREDVLAVADAYHRNDRDGRWVPALKGTLDMVLTRHPKPHAEHDNPFQVYAGGGKLVSVTARLAEHPRPTYVDLAERLHDLAAGPLGERAGDVLLLTHNGDRERPQDRFYFGSNYRSWHGSPSRKDSEVPLIVAHRQRSSAELGDIVERALGDRPYSQQFAELLLRLRYGPEATSRGQSPRH